MTKAFEFQKFLRENGPKSFKEIRDAGFRNFTGKTRERMLSCGAITTYTGPNPHSEGRYARIITTLYMAGDEDYKPPRGRRLGTNTASLMEAAKVGKWIKALEARGYTVTKLESTC